MKYCMKCGVELPDEAKFCMSCGSPVDGASDLDTELKKQQLENEKNKAGCGTMFVVGMCGLVLCVTAGPVVGMIVIGLGVAAGIYQSTKK